MFGRATPRCSALWPSVGWRCSALADAVLLGAEYGGHGQPGVCVTLAGFEDRPLARLVAVGRGDWSLALISQFAQTLVIAEPKRN